MTSVLLILQAAAFAQYSIRLSGVPERLSFPAPAGANLALTATITGGPIRSVWLAPDAASSTRVPLAKVGEGEYQVNLYKQDVFNLLKGRDDDGEFQVFAKTAEGETVASIAVRYTIEVVPKRLDFPWDRATMTICQRETKELPGSHGRLRVRLGDITAGQVLLTVHGPRDDVVIDTTSAQEGDALPLVLDEEGYVFVVDRLVNLVVGQDYGVFSLFPSRAWEREKIDRLLQAVETSELTFIRNAQEFTGVVFAAHLRLKLEYSADKPASVGEFIDKIATQSSVTGKPYQVKLADGEIVDAAIWLRQQAVKASAKEEINEERSDR